MNRRTLLAALCSLTTGCGLWLDASAPRMGSEVGMDAGAPDALIPLDVDLGRDLGARGDVDSEVCTFDEDCTRLDGTCLVGRCVDNVCVPMVAGDGVACEDATGCRVGTCMGGACDAQPRDCTAFDSVCTVGTCSSGTGCRAEPRAPSACTDDGDFCSWSDACRMGTCRGRVTDCGVRADVIPRANTRPFGNLAAPDFADTCPEGQVMIGFQASLTPDYWPGFLGEYSMLCGVVAVTPDALPTLTITPGATLPVPGRGTISPGRTIEPRMCPLGHVVVGVEGARARRDPLDASETIQYLSQLRVRCAPLRARSEGPGRTRVEVGVPIVTGTTLGTQNELEVPAVDCPAGMVAMGSAGHANEILDALGLRCGTVELSVITTAPSPGTSVDMTLFRDDCPYGHVPVGVRAALSMIAGSGLYDRNLTQLETLCAPITLAGSGPGSWTTSIGAVLPTRSTHGTRTGGAPVTQMCGSNQVIIGYSGDGGAAMTRVFLRCARVNVMGDLGALRFSRGPVTSLGPIGLRGDVPFATTDCPTGTVGSGFFGSAAEVVSDLALRCAAPTFVGR